MSHGYEYGNARLRARHAALMGRADYERLLERDPQGQLAVLAHTTWRPQVEEASTRYTGLRCVQEAARRHLAQELAGIRGFYADEPLDQLDALLARWDRRNLVTLVRAAVRGRPSDEVATTVVPAGALDEASLRALADAGDPKVLVDTLVSWREPVGRALLAVWPAFKQTGDLGVLERAIVTWDAARFLARRGDLDPLVAEAIGLGLAREEVVLAVRLRAARESGEELVANPDWIADQDLPGGALRRDDLWDVVRSPSRAEAARVLASRPGLGAWEGALRAWATTGDVEALAEEIDRDVSRRRLALRYRSDPLGPGPIVAYVEALEVEARNVRVLAAGKAAGLAPEEIRPRVWEA